MAIEQAIGAIGIGLLQLLIGLILAMGGTYAGFILFDKILREIDLQEELKKKNMAVGIVAVAIMITIAGIISTGVAGITKGLFGQDFVHAAVGGIIQLIIGIIFAVIAIYLAFKIWDIITTEIEETDELKNNNIAIGVIIAGVLIAVGFVIQGSVNGISNAFATLSIFGVIIGLLQLVMGLILAIATIYIGFSLFDKILKEIDLQEELKKGNVAIGVLSAAIMITLAEVTSSAVSGITSGLSGKEINVVGTIIGGITQLIIGIIFAVIAIYLALYIWNKITKKIEETDELKNNNIAIGVVMAGVLIAVGFVIQGSISGIATAILAGF